MTLLSRRALVAITTVVDVALHARPTPVSAKALTARHGLGPRHLEGILQALVGAGILKGLRGPRGGYQLARERRRVTVGEIVRAAAPSRDPDDTSPASLITDVIAPALSDATRLFLLHLDGITVEQLCLQAERLSPGPQGEADGDFTI